MMAKTKWLKASLVASAVSTALFPTVVLAKSVTVTGDIQTKSPNVTYIAAKPTVEAFVEPAAITIKEGNNSGCTLTTDQQIAMDAKNNDGLTCQFDFAAPFNMQKVATDGYTQWALSGLIDQVGSVAIPITSTFYSGSANTPVVIPTANINIQSVPPIPLNVLSVEYVTSNNNKGSGDVFEVNSPNQGRKVAVTLNTERKDYDRVITLPEYGSCTISSGKGEPCYISLNDYEFGNEDDRYGEITIDAFADANNGYFLANELNPIRPITIKWDSRLPEYVKMASGDQPNNKTITLDDGSVLTAEDGTWVIALKTPHYARTDNWWNLTGRGRLVPDSAGHEDVPDVIINGANYSYMWKSRGTPSSGIISPMKTEYVGEYVVMTYDVTSTTSADYEIEFTFEDQLGNNIEVQEQSIIENVDIEFMSFIAGREAGETKAYPAFFPTDVQFALFSRFRELTIESVKIDGRDVSVEDVSGVKSHYKLTSFPADTPSGQELIMEVVVTDNQSKTYTYETPLIVQPFGLTVRNEDAYANVQRYEADLRQNSTVSGTRDCKLYDDIEDARGSKFEFSSELHCYIDWVDLDPEFETQSMTSKYLLKGFPAAPSPTYQYRTHFFDSYGNESVSEVKTIELIGLDVPPIEMTIESGDIIEGDAMQAFATPVAGGRVAEVKAKMINADGQIVATNPFGDDTVTLVRQSGVSTSASPRSTIKVYTDPGQLWQVADLSVKVGYDRDDQYDKVEQIRMVYVPDEDVTALVDMEDVNIVNSKPYTMTTGIGVYDKKTKEYWYDKHTHGEWMVTLQEYIGNKEYKNVAGPQLLQDNGQAKFTFDPSGLVGAESYRFRIVADIISKYDGYSRNIQSRDTTFKTHKGGAIDGYVSASTTDRTVPFKYRGTLEFNTKADKKAYGDITWHFRNVKNSTWTQVTPERAERFEYTFTDVGTYEVRATVENKYTGAISTIFAEKLLAYEEVESSLIYNGTEYVNQPNVVKLDLPKDASAYDIEWSEDKCETFTVGGIDHTFVRAEETKVDICARVSLKETEQAGNKRWTVIKKKITVKEPSPLKVKVKTSKTSEVGFPTTLTATVQTDSYIGHEAVASWYRPDGTAIPTTVEKVSSNKYNLSATYTITEDDLNSFKQTLPFYVQAQLPAVAETFAKTEARMAVLAYEFPEFEMTIDQDYIFAPTEVDVFIKMVEEPEVNMVFSYDWLTRDGSELGTSRDSRTGSRAKYYVKDAGLNDFAVLISDERGNEVLLTGQSAAEEPQPAEVELKTTFSNDHMRYPLDVVVRPSVDYDHKSDKVLRAEYYVNGLLELDAKSGTKLYYTAEEAGDVTVKYITYSKLGVTDEKEISFTVIPNIRPVCELEMSEATSSYNFKARCSDADGRVKQYLMEFPELGLAGSTKEYRLTKNATELVGKTSFIVRMTATDDSFESTQIEKLFIISEPKEEEE
ncbi:hypothetical protein OH460_08885 [Vibrio sp. Makdt]|uniref:hypothetical protein n=1 Tax=Vibrio sp. Makdt TaxID=2998828 RepID=UPI0022CD90D2|nr:hypothetical protein [Vibrio sp. Makdt]MDA0152416.1 hypothetical protein [Vibrio sp. Makdt]